MHTHTILLLALTMALAGCGNRSAPGAGDAGVSGDIPAVHDQRPGDTMNMRDWLHPVLDRSLRRPDRSQPRLDQGAPATFCQGGPAAQVDNKPVKVSKVASHMDYIASCCGPGEVIDFQSLNANGTTSIISLQITRWPNVTLPPSIKLNLANPNKGWYVAIYCSGSPSCGSAFTTSHAFEGWIEIQSLLGGPAVQISACVTAKPTNPITPNKHHIRLWAHKVLVNKVCVPGMDQTCNADPKISSLRGKCNPDSTCTCIAGAKKMANGKCM